MRDYLAEIKSMALTTAEEICGLLLYDQQGSLLPVPARNISPDKYHTFDIDPQEHLRAHKTGRLVGYYHSHSQPEYTHAFSERDLIFSEAARLPVFVYAISTDKFNLHKPIKALPPYEGRQFILGFQDCVSLVSDFYLAEHGVRFPYFARHPLMLLPGQQSGQEQGIELMAREGFTEVGTHALKRSDILVFSNAGNQSMDHVAVYAGDGLYYHQEIGHLSRLSSLTSSRIERIRRVYRKIQR